MEAAPQSLKRVVLGLLGLCAIYALIVWILPRPAAISPAGWRLLGIFVATIVGLMLQPLPGGALVLLAVTATALSGTLSISQALAGYGNSTVWLVLAAFFIARALIKTGLARRIALVFVRLVGTSALGVAYALIGADATLAAVIPSNAARAGGVILPILRSLAELYGSLPGETAARLGTFLFVAVYQGECIAASMYLTGQASNPLAAGFARSVGGVTLDWASWFVAGVVPGILAIIVVPWVVSRLLPPTVRRTPEAAAFARRELEALGPVDRSQWIVLVVFVLVCGLWLTARWHGLGITEVALVGSAALFCSGVLTWDDAIGERAAWDVFIWYGGLTRLGEALNDFGVTKVLAHEVGSVFSGLSWPTLLVVTLIIYYYAHYGFASITTHILAMYPAFVGLLIQRGAPAGLVVLVFAMSSNLSAGLTHYGTTPAPMFYAHGYVRFGQWWRVGLIASLINLTIFSTLGPLWWKLLGRY